jgi:hypothetical protein
LRGFVAALREKAAESWRCDRGGTNFRWQDQDAKQPPEGGRLIA